MSGHGCWIKGPGGGEKESAFSTDLLTRLATSKPRLPIRVANSAFVFQPSPFYFSIAPVLRLVFIQFSDIPMLIIELEKKL